MSNVLTHPSPWNAQVLRVTLFLREPMDGAGLWERVVGMAPMVDEHRPREHARRQVGPIADASFELQVTAPRLDWVMTPAVAEGSIPSIHFGSIDTALKRFDDLLRPWLKAPPDTGIVRIAFGLIAVLPMLNRVAAYERLQRLVPSVRFDAEHTREVLYRVNRPKPSRVLLRAKLNRITTWTSIGARTYFAVIGATPSLQTIAGGEDFFVRCECDHSTSAETTGPLENASLRPIYDELREMAIENVERGELP